MDKEYMLTTIDNPYNPFTDFTSWFDYDVEKGYNTCAYLAHIARLSDDMSEQESNAEVQRAIDAIIKYDFMNMYKRVSKADS